ncbi:MAG: hemolysin family protein [Acidobacteriota bacterium]
MSPITIEILLIVLLVLANGLFAMAEIAVVSSRKARLEQSAKEGRAGARRALDLANDPGRFLSTVQMGITLIGILAGAYGGATLAEQLAELMEPVPLLAPYRETLGLGVVVLCITYLSLILGELVPKQLALAHPEPIASAIATPMRLLSRIAAPAVWLLTASTEAVLRVLSIRRSSEPPITEAEIKLLMRQGAEAGVFEKVENEMVQAALRLGDRRVGALMTPRADIVWLDAGESPAGLNEAIVRGAHPTSMPVGEGTLDRILGIVHTKDLLVQSLQLGRVDLPSALRQPLFVPECARALEVVELFKRTRTHVALVVDEHGGTQGILTPTDILEALVGDLPMAGETVEPPAVRREDGSWLVDGSMPVDEFKELLPISELPGEARRAYQTLGGFVMMQLGHVPAAGEHFEWGGFRFEVVDMDRHRVDKLLIAPLESQAMPEISERGPEMKDG